MSDCKACEREFIEAKRTKLLNDARDWAKKQGLEEAVILEGPNGHRYYCARNDPRAARLTIVEYVSVVP